MSLPEWNLKRQKKIAECEKRVEMLHTKYPRLEEITRLFAEMSVEMALLAMNRGKMGMTKEELQKAMEALQAEKKVILKQNKIPDNIYDVWWECDKCKDTGFVAVGKKCSCRLKEELEARWQASKMSPEQKNQTFTNFSLEWCQDKANCRKNMKECLSFAEKVSEGKKAESLFIYGPVGTGKTHLCSSVANYVLQAGVSVIYLKVSKLLDLIREQKFNSDKTSRENLAKDLQDLYQVGLLIIDDLGTEVSSDFVKEQLFLLLDERLNYRLPWIISTNLSPNEIGTIYEDRLSDRIMSMSCQLKFTGESVRRQKMIKRNKTLSNVKQN